MTGPPASPRGHGPADAPGPADGAGAPAPRSLCVFCGASPGTDPRHLRTAALLGAECARRGTRLVYGAGGIGVMGALSDAALAAGGTVVGVIPEALMAREFGRADLTELRVVRSMHERKTLMHRLSDAFVALPGGYGTLEELFEITSWAQLGLHRKPVVLLDEAGFFDPLTRMLDHARDQGFVSPSERRLVRRAATVEEALRLAAAGAQRDGGAPPGPLTTDQT
ncbi:TIGR00730 family Rossman fold protein [Streptomyces sp. NPDC050560]|uniref:TIGR00730 family Rossman fold protein n=1 Tax=Streptomyces sp. NPDC050560 TaxID=3365630 RepID=UPI0037B91067